MNKRKLIFTSGIANSFEWYDYALFGHFAPVIGQKFFPDSNPDAALLKVFLVFAIGYLMRPIGGILFGIIGDRMGRRTALSAAIMCMALPTAAIGFLPTYQTIGITATILMIVFRMLQGLSMGGTLTGSISFIIEHTKKEHRGLISSVPMASICVGILMGSLVAFVTKNLFSIEDFNQWAWRLPFIIGIFIFFVGTYIKKYASETPSFEEMKMRGEVARFPLRQALLQHPLKILISVFINSTGSIIFYFEAIYLLNYLKVNRGFGENEISNLINFCYVIMIIFILFAGWLSDRIGRRKIFVINLCAIIILSPILINILESGSFKAVIIAQILLSIIAAIYIAPEPALQAELYPANIRNTALSLSYNTATSVFGGTAPYIIESLIQNTGTLTSSSYYIIACAIGSLIALYFYQDYSLRDPKVHINDK